MDRLFPLPGAELAPGDGYHDLIFPPPPPTRPYVILNFVLTIDGQSTLGSGGVTGIGSRTDHRLMQELRVPVDGLLHAAGTVRADNFVPGVSPILAHLREARGLATQPLAAVLTRSGDLDPASKYFTGRTPLVFTTTSSAPGLRERLGTRATVIAAGDLSVDLAAALKSLRERHDVKLLLCEGGPELAYDLLAGGLLDELFLTLAPKLGADRDALRLLHGAPFPINRVPQLELLHLLREGSELFLRYRIMPASA